MVTYCAKQVRKSLIYHCRNIRTFLLKKSCWVFGFSLKFSEPATKTHFEPCKYSSLCPEHCETTDSYLQARHLITEIWEQHASPPSFITLPPLGSTRCDSISGRLVEIAMRQRCLIDGGGACQLPQPFPVSYKILLFFFFYHFLFDFLFHQVHLYRTGWSQVILRWQTLIRACSHKIKGRTCLERGGGGGGVRLGRKTRHRLVGK